VRALTYLPSASVTRVHAELAPGAVSGVNAGNQTGFTLPVVGTQAASPTRVRLHYDDQGFRGDTAVVPPGPVDFEIENSGAQRGSLLLINWPPEVVAMPVKPSLEFEPYLSGGMLLTRQTFRRLFRSERVDDSEGLGVRQVTLLFTDLKGSTALYERLGDLNAYALVRQHFTLIQDAVQTHAGAVVKTIGDAVMAAFFRPEDAVAAALRMLQAIDGFNRQRGATDIILKIGAHAGHSIAVTLNENLDYFGQTVNIAARVQALAEAGEICLSETVYTAPGVRDLLSSCRVSASDASLRGIAGDTRVHHVTTPRS
jgi:class 3 adenylate cyclase